MVSVGTSVIHEGGIPSFMEVFDYMPHVTEYLWRYCQIHGNFMGLIQAVILL